MSVGVAHGAIDQDGCYGGIDTSGEGADGSSPADLGFYLRYGCVDEMLRSPGRFRAADVEREVAEDVGAERRVVDFGMELHGPHFALGVFYRGNCVRSVCGEAEAWGQFFGGIAVRHPDF